MLRPPTINRAEKILVYGSEGTGKTTSWLNIAKWYEATESDGQFYVIDTDRAVLHMLESSNQYPTDRIHVREAYEWQDYEEALREFHPLLRQHDWLVVDFAGQAWEAVQDWYVSKFYDPDPVNFWVQQREMNKKGLEGWVDWPTINKVYGGWVKDLCFPRQRYQLFLTAQAAPISDTDPAKTKALYSRFGSRPKSQKNLGYQVHTVLYQSAIRPGEVKASTVKDRERTPLEAAPIAEFAVDYLVGVAGWLM